MRDLDELLHDDLLICYTHRQMVTKEIDMCQI